MHKPLAPTGDPRWTETGAVIQHAATPYYPPTADRRGYACKPPKPPAFVCLRSRLELVSAHLFALKTREI